MNWFTSFFRSSIGCKMVTAVTGLLLLGFVVSHLLGNLTVFAGRDAMNSYAEGLKAFGPLLWVARIGLLLIFVTHIATAVRLFNANRFARPVAYQKPATVQASLASRYMILSGAVVLAYVIYHLLHLTFGVIGNEAYSKVEVVHGASGEILRERHDVYGMVVTGFQNPLIVLSYVVANALLAWHLSHGIASTLQSLGINDPRYTPWFRRIGLGLAAVLGAGYLSIPLSIYLGFVQ